MIIAFILTVFCYNAKGEFDGVKDKSPKGYYLSATYMNGSDEHSLTLDEGDDLLVSFETTKGRLTLVITSPDGEEVYAGNGLETTDFRLRIKKRGEYSIKVKGQEVKGEIKITVSGGDKSENGD